MTTTKSSPTLEAWDSLATALLIVNGRGVVFWANRAAEGLIGRPRKGLIDLSVGEVLPRRVRGLWGVKALNDRASQR